MSHNRMSRFPANMHDMKTLTELNMERTFLPNPFPNELTHIPSLTKLVVNDNKLTCDKFAHINEMNTLLELEVANNQLDNFPCDKFPQLEVLNMCGNAMHGIGNIFKLEFLQRLTLSGNQLTDIQGIGNLKHLRYLDVSHNWNLCELPEDIDSATELRELNIKYTMIREIPTCMSRLQHFEVLKLTWIHSSISGFATLMLNFSGVPADVTDLFPHLNDSCRRELQLQHLLYPPFLLSFLRRLRTVSLQIYKGKKIKFNKQNPDDDSSWVSNVKMEENFYFLRGALYRFALSTFGQLADDYLNQSDDYLMIVYVSPTSVRRWVIDEDNVLYLATSSEILKMKRMPLVKQIISLTSRNYLVVTTKNTVWSFELGHPTVRTNSPSREYIKPPTQCKSFPPDVGAISSGNGKKVVFTSSGKLYVTGESGDSTNLSEIHPELGTEINVVFVKSTVEADLCYAVDATNGQVWEVTLSCYSSNIYVKLLDIEGVEWIEFIGTYNTVFVKYSGEVLASGQENKQLHFNSSKEPVSLGVYFPRSRHKSARK